MRVTPPLPHELIESIYFDDPNGIQLEITRPLRTMSDTRRAGRGVDAARASPTSPSRPAPPHRPLWQRKAELDKAPVRNDREVAGP